MTWACVSIFFHVYSVQHSCANLSILHTTHWPPPERSLPWWQSAAAAHLQSWCTAVQNCSLPGPVAEYREAVISHPAPHTQKKNNNVLRRIFSIYIKTEYQPRSHRCPLCPQCYPSLWDSASHWSALTTSRTALNTRLWQWHLYNRGNRMCAFKYKWKQLQGHSIS